MYIIYRYRYSSDKLANVNKVAMNIEMYLSLRDPIFISFRSIPRSGFLDHVVVLLFNFFNKYLCCLL